MKRILAIAYLSLLSGIVIIGVGYAAILLVMEAIHGNPDARESLAILGIALGVVAGLFACAWALQEIEP